MKAPFPYFGGKSRAAREIWNRLGDVPNYVEPFAGSCAVLLARPAPGKVETINDADGLLSNFWRALKHDPASVIDHAEWPVNECDLHARHLWLIGRRDTLTDRLMADPDYYDAKAAGWWVWGACAWIASGWCSGKGPWTNEDGLLVLRNPGQGINRQLPHLRNPGQGINRQLPHLGDPGRGPAAVLPRIAARMRWVRVACGDWARVCTPSITHRHGLTGVLLDPPYLDGAQQYSAGGTGTDLALAVRDWALREGENPKMRIALCGYEGHYDMPASWSKHRWMQNGGYGNLGEGANKGREVIFFSPHCLNTSAPTLFTWR